jgi:glycosyltransferase involved in cell wall biosynthesis
MRVAFLTHEPFDPPSGGGSAEAVYLVAELTRRGHAVHLFCPAFPDAPGVATRSGITVHPFTRWPMGRYARFRNLKYLRYPRALARWVESELAVLRRVDPGFRFDVLLAQHTISAVAAVRLRCRLGVPAVLNYLDFLTGFMETWPAPFTATGLVGLLNRFELSLPRRYGADGVMAVSQPLADRLAATGFPAERIRAIQYGYDAARFRPPETEPDPSRPVVVMHGSFDRHHLGGIAREAVIQVARRRPGVTFRFLGTVTPGLARFVADVRRRVPAVRLECPGFVPYADMGAELGRATVGIVPYEASRGTHCAFVAKAVEYLGCGRMVVSTPLENLRTYFAGEKAIRFTGFDGEGFGRAILDWLDAPVEERLAAGRAASARVARELDWSVVAGRAAEFVELCASRPGTPRPTSAPVPRGEGRTG